MHPTLHKIPISPGLRAFRLNTGFVIDATRVVDRPILAISLEVVADTYRPVLSRALHVNYVYDVNQRFTPNRPPVLCRWGQASLTGPPTFLPHQLTLERQRPVLNAWVEAP